MRHTKILILGYNFIFFPLVAFHQTFNCLLLFLANVQSQIFQGNVDTYSHSVCGYQ